MTMRGIQFVACEFSMSERNISKAKIIPESGFIKVGIIQILTKEEGGWSYIKFRF
jgi:intracellular sulfur oxidation DsrE/DsrF family protein